LFLEPKGRIMFDSIISKVPSFDEKEPAFLIDVHRDASESLSNQIKKFSFRKEVQMHDLEGIMEAYATLSPYSYPEEEEGTEQKWEEIGEEPEVDPDLGRPIKGYTAFVDPRTRILGVRTIALEDCMEVEDEISKESSEYYKMLRILAGVPEGSYTKGMIPHQLNFQALNAIDFSKGCYVGQELVARTQTQGQVRTFALPFAVCEEFKNPKNPSMPIEFVDMNLDLNESRILDQDGNEVAEVLESYKNVGIAKVRVQKAAGKQLFTSTGKTVILWSPLWLQLDSKDIGQ